MKIYCANCKEYIGDKITASVDELKANFGNFEPTECDVVCDNCYKKILAWKKSSLPAGLNAGETKW